MSDRTVLLVDCMGLLYRGHFAMSRRPLTSPEGVVTSGLQHLVTELLKLVELHEPGYCAAVFDGAVPSFRKDIYPEYKANRPPMPDDLIIQSDLARELIPALGIPMIQRDTFEADDLIAGLAARAEALGCRTVILSSDKDLLQLVTPGTWVYRPGRPGAPGRLVTPDQVRDEIGTTPDRVPLLLALAGDSSDNIPGARGIGMKTALKLVEDHGTLEELMGALDTLPPPVAAKLTESREDVEMSLRLVTLNMALPEDIRLEDAVVTGVTPRAFQILEKLGMNRIIEKLGEGTPPEPAERYQCSPVISDGEDFQPPAADGPVAIDTETDSRNPLLARPLGISICAVPGRALFLSLREGLSGETTERLAGLLERNGWIAQNSKFDLHILRRLGLSPPVPGGDPYLADYLLRPEETGHGLKSLALHWLGRKMETFAELTENAALEDLPREKVAAYCCADSSAALELSRLLDEKLRDDPFLHRVYRHVELPLVTVLAHMEERGVGLNSRALAETGEELRARLAELCELGNRQAGRPVNLGSPGQVSRVLFSELGLPPVRKTPGGGLSSSMSVLQTLEGAHPFVATVMEYRELSKLLSTYIDSLPRFVNPETGLIHTTFNQAVTATGRLSSSDPNLQNIPIRSPMGRRVRRCFVPGKSGCLFVSADYSQIELRVLAHLAGEGALRRAYREERDIHALTAASVFEEVNPDTRRKAKEVNFSIVYGISPFGLAGRLGVSRGEAAGIINRYFDTYPEVEAFYRKTVQEASEKGETRTILGRRRGFPGLARAKGQNRKHLERMAVNTTVQGSAADIVKLAMIRVHERLARELPEAGMVIQVHDELVIESPENLAEHCERILREEMEGAFDLEAPLSVETGTGDNWLSAGH